MKNTIFIILGFLTSTFLSGQQMCFSSVENPVYTKNYICFYDSSCTKIKEVYFLIDEGKVIGKNIMWDENGHVISVYSFRYGIATGVWTNWSQDGNKVTEQRYSYDSSYVTLPMHYTTDTLFIGDFPSVLLSRGYKNPRVGDFKRWYKNGSLWIEGKFKDYKCTKEKSDEIKIGVWKYYFDDGTLAMEKYYDNNGKLLHTKIIK